MALLLLLVGGAACSSTREQFLPIPVPLIYENKLLYAHGQALPSQSERCGVAEDSGGGPPPVVAAPRVLVDTAVPLSAFSGTAGEPAQAFRHGELLLQSPAQPGLIGAPRFLLCDVPVLRSNQPAEDFLLQWGAAQTGPLGAVFGGDLWGRFALTFTFRPSRPQLTISRSDISTSCQLPEVVLPFRPLGGELAVQVNDAVITYPPRRITLSACFEPLSDPLAPAQPLPCLEPGRLLQAEAALQVSLTNEKTKAQPNLETVARLQASIDEVQALRGGTCAGRLTSQQLGDLAQEQQLRDLAYTVTGVDMRLLLSTAVPELILSQTACQRLRPAADCTCEDSRAEVLRLPGLNTKDDVEKGCRIKLGGGGKAALALVARGRHLGPCAELSRSRRQRYALPRLDPGGLMVPPCYRDACLVNELRDSALSAQRCGYSGPDIDLACDDQRAPVAPILELGGSIDGAAPVDQLEALVVPDAARVLQSANADLRNVSPQVDGVLGVSVLARLHSTVDYPQNRVVLSCNCDDTPAHLCQGYRGVTYRAADVCVTNDELLMLPDFGRVACR